MVETGDEKIEVGIDTGGTFTDVICFRGGRVVGTAKVPSTPADPSVAILQAVEYLEREWQIEPVNIERLCHGTTVATNALIERKGGCVGLLATEGFSDVIEIGRQMRRELYEVTLKPQTPVFLAPGRYRRGIRERVAADGSVLVPLDEQSVRLAARELVDAGVEAIAISFLFSFLNPDHEMRARDIIAAEYPELTISISSEVDPTFREYERTVATAFDAYVKPVVDRYLARLGTELARLGIPSEPKVMQSRGGMSAVSVARQRPVRLFLSGPAAGVVGASATGQAVNIGNLISVDIGGTSSDIALIEGGRPSLRAEGEIEGYPVRVNMVDVNAIGAGGGSLVWLDAAGGLRVGPGSAGADPGPACYGRGGEQATVTDASIVLGYLNPDYFAGGSMCLNPQRAHDVIAETVAKPLGFTVERAAQGIHRVINAQMAEGIRQVSIRRGYDPRRFALVALGGAGAVHAAALAEELDIGKVIVPRTPGVLSAAGLLMAPIEHEVTTSMQRELNGLAPSEVTDVLQNLDNGCRALMAAEGVATEGTEISHFADVCYVGQSHYLGVPLNMQADAPFERLYSDFKAEHDRIHGHAMDAPVRVVNLRSVHMLKSDIVPANDGDIAKDDSMATDSQKTERDVLFVNADAPISTKVYNRDGLMPGHKIAGPAIIEQADTTTVVPPGWEALVQPSGDIILENPVDAKTKPA
jgi:N-methylhydantoinase A